MADTIIIDPPSDRSTRNATVVPDRDGIFIISLEAKAQGNGNGTPVMWAEALIDGRLDKKTGEIAWADGVGTIHLTTAERLEGGKDYSIRGVSGNRNADALSLGMEVYRAGE